MDPLTKKQREVLDYILKVMRERDYTPSYREIADALSLSSPATVHEHVGRFKEKGYLKDLEGAPVVVERGLLESAKAVLLPLMGLITAGEPIEAMEDKETMAVPASIVVDGANAYVLKVKGRSMIEDGILDGDFVIVERNPSPKNGDVVVAVLEDNEATLKRFYKEKDRVRLQPANSTMKPIYAKSPEIRGVVKAVIRKF